MLGQAILRSNFISSNIKEYISFIVEILEMGDSISFGSFLEEMHKLKKHPRAGWVDRNILNPETVAAHMYNMWLLGYICLPEQSSNRSYNKERILKMVLLHDLGEAPHGDIPKTRKTQEDEVREERTIRKYSFLNSYMHNGIDKTNDFFHTFRDNERDINARIARELDRLDNLQQLYHYQFVEGYDIADFTMWEGSLIRKIDTTEGKKILSYIMREADKKRLLHKGEQ